MFWLMCHHPQVCTQGIKFTHNNFLVCNMVIRSTALSELLGEFYGS
jgi:hypothetical protein